MDEPGTKINVPGFFNNVKTAMNFWALTECISIDKAIWVSTLRK
nr:hypothetical protein [Staphylococcus epidermidis]